MKIKNKMKNKTTTIMVDYLTRTFTKGSYKNHTYLTLVGEEFNTRFQDLYKKYHDSFYDYTKGYHKDYEEAVVRLGTRLKFR